MKKINRRSFITQTSLTTAGIFAFAQLPKQLFAGAEAAGMPLGFQSWVVKDMLAKDFAGTMKMVAGQGYQLIEMCSPKGYKDTVFGSLVDMKPAEMRTIIQDAGLSCPSCHFGMAELTSDQLEDRIGFAKGLGMTQMICPSFWLPKTATLDDYLKAADKLNVAGEKIKKNGMQAGFHNHETEFGILDGQLIYDALMERFDPELVKMQFQTQVITVGIKASDYFTKYPGRFISAHLSDWTADKKEVPIGQGIIDWKAFFETAKVGGVENYFVEMKPETFTESAEYIHELSLI